MKPRIAIPLGVGGILAAIGTTIANANALFAGHPSLAYWFWAASFAMIVIAVAGWLFGAETSSLQPPPLPPPPSPISVHQENKQTQTFNPQVNVHVGTDARTARLEREHTQHEEHEELVMQFLEVHRGRPGHAVPFLVKAVANGIILPERDTADALERLVRKNRVYRSSGESEDGFFYWLADF
jgi:hypothetical protein